MKFSSLYVLDLVKILSLLTSELVDWYSTKLNFRLLTLLSITLLFTVPTAGTRS